MMASNLILAVHFPLKRLVFCTICVYHNMAWVLRKRLVWFSGVEQHYNYLSLILHVDYCLILLDDKLEEF